MIFRRVGDSSADYYVQCRKFRLKKAGRWKRFLNCSAVHGNYFIFVTSIADGKGRLVYDGSCDACKHRETSSAFLTTDIPECGGTNIIPREREKTDSEVGGGSESDQRML